MPNYRMFSPPALLKFKEFLAVDAATRSPPGAFDAMPRRLSRDKRMTGDNGEEYDREAVKALMGYLMMLQGDDRLEAVKLLDQVAPGCLEGYEPGEEGMSEDDDPADLDEPAANAGGKPYRAEDEPPPFATGGRPTTHGAVDPLRKDRPFAGHAEDGFDSALRAGERIGLDPMYHGIDRYGQTRRAPALALDSAITDDAEKSWTAMFGGGRRKQIGVV
jgi:hypothetical protein